MADWTKQMRKAMAQVKVQVEGKDRTPSLL